MTEMDISSEARGFLFLELDLTRKQLSSSTAFELEKSILSSNLLKLNSFVSINTPITS